MEAQRGMFGGNKTVMIWGLFAVFLSCVTAKIDGCSPILSVRNPYICTPEQLRKAAITITNQIESYMSPLNTNVLYKFVLPSTVLLNNLVRSQIGGIQCCEKPGTLWGYLAWVEEQNGAITFINQTPTSAVISEVEGVVRVLATIVIYNESTYQSIETSQIAFVWKPMYQEGVIADCSCNLELLRIELRSPFCNFNEPHCLAHK